MKKIVILSQDTKTVREVQQWLKDLPEEVLVESIAEPAEFRKKYCAAPRPEAEGAVEASSAESEDSRSEGDAESVDLDDLGENSQRHFLIAMLVVDIECLAAGALEWALETRELLMQHGYSKEEEPTRLMLVGFAEAEFDIDKFRHETIDDFLLKPLDKALFLQKAEVYLTAGESVRASFLFKQRTEMAIEMGKDSWIESVSEFGFAIRNPAPLAAGVYARVYSRLFGEGPAAGLIGRVYRSERHPTEQGTYLCHLAFHGITSAQLSEVRKIIRQDKSLQQKAPVAPPEFMAAPKSVVVIDMNADARATLRDSLTANFANVQIREFPSYSSFLKFSARRIVESGRASSVAPADGTPAAGAATVTTSARRTLAGEQEISFLIQADTKELVGLDPAPKVTAKVLGITAEDLLGRGSAWFSLFGQGEQEEIAEFITYVCSGQTGHLMVIADGGEVGHVRLRIHGKVERSGETDGVMLLRLTLREVSEEEFQEGHGSSLDEMLTGIDAIYIDGSLLGEDRAASLEGLLELLKKARLIESRESLTVTILGDERSRLAPAEFRLRTVQDFLYKPLDRKLVITKALVLIKGFVAKTDAIDLSRHRVGRAGRITKEVLMEELSEFGLQIRHETPLKEHTFLRFFSPVFLDQGDGILGRCLFSSKDPDTGLYHCFFSFFGVSDAQLKNIRKWIRGDYAARKEKAGG